jgi:hypothetical protein
MMIHYDYIAINKITIDIFYFYFLQLLKHGLQINYHRKKSDCTSLFW